MMYLWYWLFVCFLLGMAHTWYPWCCCVSAPPCTTCSADADTVSLTIANFAAGTTCDTTNCTAFNGTWILTRSNYDPCLWFAETMLPCTTSPATPYWYWLRARATTNVPPSGNWGWLVDIIYWYGWSAEQATHAWNSGGTSAFDCTATRSTTQIALSGGTGYRCSGWSSLSVQIN